MKRLRKILSLTVLFLLLSLPVTPAWAAETAPGPNAAEREAVLENFRTEGATARLTAQQAPLALKAMAESNGIAVKQDSVFEIIPLSDANAALFADAEENPPQALCVTNVEGDQVSKNIMLVLEKRDGSTYSVGPPNSSYYYIDFTKDTSIVVTGAALFTWYQYNNIKLIHPLSAGVLYKEYSSTNVDWIDTIYVCKGRVYTWPGLQVVTDHYSHGIEVNELYPKANQWYFNDSPAFPDDNIFSPQEGTWDFDKKQGMTIKYRIAGQAVQWYDFSFLT